MTTTLISRYRILVAELRCWELDSKLGTFTQPTVYLDGSTHLFHSVFDNGQAQAGPAHGSRSCLIGAIEALEDARQIFRGDADAGIADQDANLAVIAAHFHLHFAIRAIELYRVIQQIDEDLLQTQLITDHFQ